MAKYNEGGQHPKRNFKTPDDLLKAWGEFKNDLDIQSTEWLKVLYVGKDGQRVAEPTKVPMTFEGFKRFCRNNYGEVGDYFDNKLEYYNDFSAICREIKDEIRENQIIGGLMGFYNPSITQRLNNLSETTKTEISGGLNIPELPDIGDRK